MGSTNLQPHSSQVSSCPPISMEKLMNFQLICCIQACSPAYATTAFSSRNHSINTCHICAFYCVFTRAHQVVLLEPLCHKQSLKDPLLLNPALPSTTLSHPWRMTRECWQPRELRNAQDHLRSDPSLLYNPSSSS